MKKMGREEEEGDEEDGGRRRRRKMKNMKEGGGGSVVQFLWSLSESYCFPGSTVSFSDPQRKR
jgi:hypothetical protein